MSTRIQRKEMMAFLKTHEKEFLEWMNGINNGNAQCRSADNMLQQELILIRAGANPAVATKKPEASPLQNHRFVRNNLGSISLFLAQEEDRKKSEPLCIHCHKAIKQEDGKWYHNEVVQDNKGCKKPEATADKE